MEYVPQYSCMYRAGCDPIRRGVHPGDGRGGARRGAALQAAAAAAHRVPGAPAAAAGRAHLARRAASRQPHVNAPLLHKTTHRN